MQDVKEKSLKSKNPIQGASKQAVSHSNSLQMMVIQMQEVLGNKGMMRLIDSVSNSMSQSQNSPMQLRMDAKANISGTDVDESADGSSGHGGFDRWGDELENVFSQSLPGVYTEKQIKEESLSKLGHKKKSEYMDEWEVENSDRKDNVRPRTQCAEPRSLINLLSKLEFEVTEDHTITISDIKEGSEQKRPCKTCQDWVENPDDATHSVKGDKISKVIEKQNEQIDEKKELKVQQERAEEERKKRIEEAEKREKAKKKNEPEGLALYLDIEEEVYEDLQGFVSVKELRDACSPLYEWILDLQASILSAERKIDKIHIEKRIEGVKVKIIELMKAFGEDLDEVDQVFYQEEGEELAKEYAKKLSSLIED